MVEENKTNKRMSFVKHYKIHFFFAVILMLVSGGALIFYGLNLGIDFTGGSILELAYQEARPNNQAIRVILEEFDLGEYSLQPTGDSGVIIRSKELTEETHNQIIEKLKADHTLEEKRFESIGPTVGKELSKKTGLIIGLSLLAIVLYIAFVFRKVSFLVKSWQYGVASLIILSHDVLIILGIFSVLGKFYDVQITTLIITALLTVIGYAINNVVVVYDRLRENLLGVRAKSEDFTELTNKSIKQTLSRQINTSLTTLIPLLFIFFMGGETLKYFALTLIIGIVIGTYSSIFLAGPILFLWLRIKK